MKKVLTTLSIFSTLTISSVASASDVSLGIAGGLIDSPYKGYGAVYDAIPYVYYDDGLFYVNGLSAGAYAYNDNDQAVTLGINYLVLQFDPKKSDDEQLKQLKKRNSTLLAEVGYSLSTKWGDFATKVGADVLNESNSVIVNANYSYPIYGENWSITPKIGLNWTNSSHNNHYFGVSHKESARSELAYHDADSAITPYIELSGQYMFTENINAFVGVRIDKLTSDAANSPMIAHSTVASVFGGVAYTF
ncbi:MipA/OmpV family protein [Orbus sasakiae]|uniref:MipA/OmpV family protein n=1 Tax=Orbus sasakiae TaxID=1078475 RepID=A0ABP9NEZ2_9GAMM